MRARRALAGIVTGGLLAAGTLALAATSRIASVAPPGSVCLGKSFQVGVRFRSGEKRTYSIKVIEPTGGVLFSKSGKAKKTWMRWTVTPRMAGAHRVAYVLAGKRKSYTVQVTLCDPGVQVTDNDGGAAALSLTDAAPGETTTSCILVTYRAARPGPVRLYGITTGTGLDEHLDLVVTRGALPAGAPFGDCSGFQPDAGDHIGQGGGVVYRGTLRDLPDDYASAVAAPSAPWANAESHAFRIELTLRDDDDAQGKTAEQTFVWEARL